MSDRLYANIVLRLQALLHDLVLYAVVATFAWILGAVVFELGASVEAIDRFVFIGFVVLYEPVLVWKIGGTWGHRQRNLKVCDQQTGANIGFLRALFRSVLKAVLGVFSLIFMISTERHQALHDLATRSTVQIREPLLPFGPRHHYLRERAEAGDAGLPSTRRRIIVILAYMVLIGVALGFARAIAVSESCLLKDQCIPTDRLIDAAALGAWIVLSAAAVPLGWKGRLLGCRRRTRDASSP